MDYAMVFSMLFFCHPDRGEKPDGLSKQEEPAISSQGTKKLFFYTFPISL